MLTIRLKTEKVIFTKPKYLSIYGRIILRLRAVRTKCNSKVLLSSQAAFCSYNCQWEALNAHGIRFIYT